MHKHTPVSNKHLVLQSDLISVLHERIKQGTDTPELINLITKSLLTNSDSEELVKRNLTVYDALTGGFGTKDEDFVYSMLNRWNEELGQEVFGYSPTLSSQE